MKFEEIQKFDKDAKFDEEHNIILTSPNNQNVYMPEQIMRDKRLKLTERFYYCAYMQYGCIEFYADKFFEKMYSKQTLIKIKKHLRELGLIEQEIVTPERAKENVIRNSKIGVGEKCEWCGKQTIAIQEHHYPIPKCNGGTEIVRICPTCHYEYHLIYKEK